MAESLPPREELPSPESQSGNSLAPPFGGAFFMRVFRQVLRQPNLLKRTASA